MARSGILKVARTGENSKTFRNFTWVFSNRNSTKRRKQQRKGWEPGEQGTGSEKFRPPVPPPLNVRIAADCKWLMCFIFTYSKLLMLRQPLTEWRTFNSAQDLAKLANRTTTPSNLNQLVWTYPRSQGLSFTRYRENLGMRLVETPVDQGPVVRKPINANPGLNSIEVSIYLV